MSGVFSIKTKSATVWLSLALVLLACSAAPHSDSAKSTGGVSGGGAGGSSTGGFPATGGTDPGVAGTAGSNAHGGIAGVRG